MRVSSQEQAARKLSIPSQIEQVQNYAKQNELIIENIYQEKVSGVSNKRPHFKLCLEQLKAGDTFVVWKLDRIGRSLIDLCHLAEDFNKRKINLICITESIDTTSPMGNFFFHIMASMAQLERDLLVERTKEGIKAAKARGTYKTRPICFEKENYDRAIEYVNDNPKAKRREVADAAEMRVSHVTKHWDKIQNATPWPWGNNTRLAKMGRKTKKNKLNDT